MRSLFNVYHVSDIYCRYSPEIIESHVSIMNPIRNAPKGSLIAMTSYQSVHVSKLGNFPVKFLRYTGVEVGGETGYRNSETWTDTEPHKVILGQVW